MIPWHRNAFRISGVLCGGAVDYRLCCWQRLAMRGYHIFLVDSLSKPLNMPLMCQWFEKSRSHDVTTIYDHILCAQQKSEENVILTVPLDNGSKSVCKLWYKVVVSFMKTERNRLTNTAFKTFWNPSHRIFKANQYNRVNNVFERNCEWMRNPSDTICKRSYNVIAEIITFSYLIQPLKTTKRRKISNYCI